MNGKQDSFAIPLTSTLDRRLNDWDFPLIILGEMEIILQLSPSVRQRAILRLFKSL